MKKWYQNILPNNLWHDKTGYKNYFMIVIFLILEDYSE
jgi:hypothetical protein